jgi:two-component system, cell cycle sensor histidine kinase and response regulator CckA
MKLKTQQRAKPILQPKSARTIAATIEAPAVDTDLSQSPAAPSVHTLERPNRQYCALLETMNEGALNLDIEGIILYANSRFLEVVGADAHGILGESIFEFAPAAEKSKLRALLAASGKSPQREEIPLRKRDGEHIPALFSMSAWMTAGGVTDISLVVTDLTHVRRQLAELEAAYRTAPVGLAVLDKSLRILRANQGSAEIFGDVLTHLTGQLIFEAAPRVAKVLSPVFERVLQHGESVLDLEVTAAADEEPLVEHTWIVNCRPLLSENQEVRAISLVMTDVTEHKRAEMERVILSRAIEQTADSILITKSDGTIVYANPACERISGFSRTEMLGQTPRLFKSGKHTPEFYRKLWETLQSGNVWSGSTVNRRKNGTYYEESATITPVRDAQGRILNYVASKRDVTHEHQLECQLRLAQKFEALGRLSGGIAHDFNNVLGAILGWAELGKEQTETGSKLRTYFEKTQAQAERAAGLVRQLLAYCRRQILERTELDLNLLTSETLAMLASLIGKQIEVKSVLAPDLRGIRADAGQVEQVILNLCLNARDAMIDGGRLVVETRNVDIDEIYCQSHAYFRPGPYVQLTVSDSGSGMDHETLDHIFEPFFTTKEIGKGTGLGLATVYGIVKQHEGFIHVYSEPGLGTNFQVYFPALAGLPKPGASDHKIESAVGGRETLLFAEDHDGMRETTSDSLSELGYRLLVAKNGAEAVELFNAYRDQIDLAVLDVVMPGMGGPEALAIMRKTRSSLPALFMTGYASGADLLSQLDSESTSLLQKPFGSKQLGAKIREIFDARAQSRTARN